MYTRVKRSDGFFNFSNDGSFISDHWFFYADRFRNGLAYVEVEPRFWNLIDKQGNFICNEDFLIVDKRSTPNFANGPRRVKRKNGYWNFINKEGNLLCKRDFFRVENFKNGLAVVEDRYGCWNFLDINGKLASYEWFLEE